MVGTSKKTRVVVLATVALGLTATTAFAARGIFLRGGGHSNAKLECPGGMARLGHVFDANASIFPGDPAPEITIVNTIDVDGFLLERVTTGTHTGTHLSAPGHFIAGAPTVDQLPASDFAWPAYVIDVRTRTAADPDFQLTVADVRKYERQVGKIPAGAMVILYTGFQDRWATPGYLDTAPGISAAAVKFLFAQRGIKGVGSDTFGPDASSDVDFEASTEVYSNGGVTIENIANLDQLHLTGDLIIAPTTALAAGSGFLTDPLGCLRD
jgi:kynurenine formamidase